MPDNTNENTSTYPYLLKWDETGKRFYESGVSRGVFYTMTAQGTYTPGVAWNGLTGVEENPEGAEPNELWADNIKYAVLYSAETWGGTIKAYTYPTEFEECDGTVEIAPGARIGQQKRKPFGFCYRTEIGNDTAGEGDDGYLLHLIYNAMAAPSDRSYDTINDSPDAIEFSWEISTTPVTVEGYKPTSSLTISSLEADATKLAALEAILYGTGNTNPRMPLPDEVKTLLA